MCARHERRPVVSEQVLSLGQTTLALVGVLVLAGVSLAILRRLIQGRLSLGGRGDGLRTLASLPLGNRRFVTVVEVGGERFLLGITPQSINLIARDVKLDLASNETGPRGFVSRLQLWRS